MTAIDRYAIRYMQMFAWLPFALHPDPRRALLISYGAGSTAQALLSDPSLRELTVVDVSPEILAASPFVHGEGDPLKDPRVKLVLEDGRQYLRTHRESFDVITAEPPPPDIAGVVNLYTRDTSWRSPSGSPPAASRRTGCRCRNSSRRARRP